MPRRFKAISPAIAAAVLIPVVILLATAVAAYIQASGRAAAIEVMEAQRMPERLQATVLWSGSSARVTVYNPGPRDTVLRYLFIHYRLADGSQGTMVIDVSDPAIVDPLTSFTVSGGENTGNGIVLPVGDQLVMNLDFGSQIVDLAVAVATDESVHRAAKVEESSTATSIATTLLVFAVPSITDLLTRSDIYVPPDLLAPGSPDNPGTGMSGSSSLWCLAAEYEGAYLYGKIYFGTAYVGFDPVWTQLRTGEPEYTIAAVYTKLGYYYTTLRINGYPVTYFGENVKVVVIGYSGFLRVFYTWINIDGTYEFLDVNNLESPEDVVGIYMYGYEAAVEWGTSSLLSWIQFDGSAERVLVYVRSSRCGAYSQVSYTPYLLIGDFDNNGLAEILYTTVDASFGDTRVEGNDRDPWFSWVDVNDYSTKPFTIIFQGYPIDSSKYVAVQVAVRYYFHDNAGEDEDELDENEWIMRIGLYNPSTREFTSWYELRYQELARYEDTYPPSWSYRIDTIMILVPQTGDTYYLALQFQDPYSDTTTGYNDADLFIAIEYLSIVYMSG